MQILLALIFGAAVGLAAHLTLGSRDSRGAAVGPVTGALVGGLAWTVLTWLGFSIDNPWLWIVAVIAPLVVVPPILVAMARMRATQDAAARQRLRIG